ncbi:MAG: type II secretion system major pseudopilin GspG [Desulfobacterales bacterium]|nr:type II secretion system major pseudopilin GspG [Desulfobacterales bacterium]
MKKNAKNIIRRKDGFSLIELLIVMVIIGLLAGIVGPRLFGHEERARRNTAKGQIAQFEAALDTYRLDMGKYPTSDQGLRALRVNPGDEQKWNGPYLKKGVPLDPWDTAYEYESPSDHGDYAIWSLGPDSAPGGDGDNADIVSWTEDDE